MGKAGVAWKAHAVCGVLPAVLSHIPVRPVSQDLAYAALPTALASGADHISARDHNATSALWLQTNRASEEAAMKMEKKWASFQRRPSI